MGSAYEREAPMGGANRRTKGVRCGGSHMSPLQGLASHGQSVGGLHIFVYVIQSLSSGTQDTTSTLVGSTAG